MDVGEASEPRGEPIPEDQIAVRVEAARRSTAGTSLVGIVAATGARATIAVGTRVVVGPFDPCGECEICRRGGMAVCPARVHRGSDLRVDEPVSVQARWATPLGDGLDIAVPGAAVVAGDAAIAYTLYARTGLGPRDPAVVVGESPIARFLVEILIAKSITPIVVADPDRVEWLAWLARRGADIARVSSTLADDVRAAVAAATAARGVGSRPLRILASDETVADRAAALAGPRATLTLLGMPTFDPAPLVGAEVTIIGVAGAHPDLVVEVAALCAKGDIDVAAGTTTSAGDFSIASRAVDPSLALVETFGS